MWTVCVLLVTCAASGQSADEQNVPARADAPDHIVPAQGVQDDDSPLHVQVTGRALYLAPGGRIIFPATSGTSKDIDVEALNLDSPGFSAGIEIDVSVKQWRFLANYVSFEQTNQGARSPTTRRIGDVDVSKGDEIVSSLRFDWGQVQVSHVLFERAVGDNARYQVTAGVGARFYDMSMTMKRVAGGRAHANPTFVVPVAVWEARFTYREAYTLRLAMDAGYSDWSNKTTHSSGITIESSAELRDGTSAQTELKLEDLNLEEGDGASAFRFDGSLAGLYAGVSFAF